MIFICYLERENTAASTTNTECLSWKPFFNHFLLELLFFWEKEINFEGFVMVKGINCLKKLFNGSFVVFVCAEKMSFLDNNGVLYNKPHLEKFWLMLSLLD